MIPKTFCILPFCQATIDNQGELKLCTHSHAFNIVTNEGWPVSLHQERMENIWNSDYMRLVRGLMLEGKEVEACTKCYQTEDNGGVSLRQLVNSYPEARMNLAEYDDNTVLEYANLIVRKKQGFSSPPTSFHLWLGNLCNLKCRFCSPLFSSAIASDPIQSQWIGEPSCSEKLLPFFLNGVDYDSFGELVKRGKKFTRLMPMGSAQITLPTNGNPIDWLLISGWKYGNKECTIRVSTQEKILVNQSIFQGQWKIWIKPDFIWNSTTKIQFSLDVRGESKFIEIDSMELATKVSNRKSRKVLVSRIPKNLYWSDSEEIIEEMLSHSESLRHIHLTGGEPLLHSGCSALLERLVNVGHSSHISLYFNTNGTVYSRRLSSLLKEFSSVMLTVSVDGVGKLQEYIRYPSKWDIIYRNILAFQKDNIPITINCVGNVYNIFGMFDLIRWCEANQIPCDFHNQVDVPRFLSFDILPQEVIEEAIQCWVEYRDHECAVDNLWQLKTVMSALKRPRPKLEDLRTLQNEFIRFTNDLDRSRNQSLAMACPKLYEKLINNGFNFEDKYRFYRKRT